MSIPISMVNGLFTKQTIAVYQQMPNPTAFLRSFFTTVESDTRYVSIFVERFGEQIAVDVKRNSEGNANDFAKTTEKVLDPAYYNEYFDATQMDLYYKLFAADAVNQGTYAEFAQQVAKRIKLLQNKIDRAIEKQCADVFKDGIITLSDGTKIDYKRKADSKSVSSDNNFATSTVSPYEVIEKAGNFLRENARYTGGVLNVIMGQAAFSRFQKNTIFIQRQGLINMGIDRLTSPQRNSEGAIYHGELSCGSYIARIWTYDQIYDKNGTKTRYLDTNQMIVLPENPSFNLGFGAVPRLFEDGGASVNPGLYHISDYKDTRKKSHIFEISSAPIAVPTAVDEIVTYKVAGF